jgi:hypothetical protein
VESGAVVEGFDVVEDGGAGLGAGSEAMIVDQFVFESAKEGLDEGVIVAVAFATHGSDQAMLGQDLSSRARSHSAAITRQELSSMVACAVRGARNTRSGQLTDDSLK